MPLLERRTRRLIIRPLRDSDYEAWRTSYETMSTQVNRWDRLKRSPETLRPTVFKKVLRQQGRLRKDDKFFDLAVFERSSGALVGTVAAMDLLRGLGQSAFLGYFIHNGYWGQGYGKEAVVAMIDIAFRDLKLHRIEAGIEPGNRRSIALARSLGLRREGLKKRAVFLRDEWVDLIMYSATCEEFGFKWKSVPQTRLR